MRTQTGRRPAVARWRDTGLSRRPGWLRAAFSPRSTTSLRPLRNSSPSGGEGCGPTPAADGGLYVTCGTDSSNLPRVGGIQSYQGQEDGYVAKLDRTGRIVYATYLGSSGQDEIQSTAVDARGHLFISSFAANGFPTTPGAYDTTFNGTVDCCGGLIGDAFVAELRADGSRLLYSTYPGARVSKRQARSRSATTAAS